MNEIENMKIMLACNLGASTSILVKKMETVVEGSEKLKDKNIQIKALSVGEIEDHINDYDVILLGPQISHRLDELKKIADAHQKPIEVINSQDYGTMNAGNVIKEAIALKLKGNNK